MCALMAPQAGTYMPMVSMNGQEFVYIQNNDTTPTAISVYPRANLVTTQEKSFVLFAEELLRRQQALSLYIEFDRILTFQAEEMYVQPVVCVLNGSTTSITPSLSLSDDTNVAAAAYNAAWVSTASSTSVAVVCMIDHLPSDGVFSLDVVLLATGQRLLNDAPTLISAPRPVIVQATQSITANTDDANQLTSIVINSDGQPGFVGYDRYRCVYSMTSTGAVATTTSMTNMTSTNNLVNINSSQPVMPLFVNETTLICPFSTSLLPR